MTGHQHPLYGENCPVIGDAPASEPLPEGFGVALDPGARRLDGGRALMGGAPLRLLRLTAAGARAVAAWEQGERPSSTAARALARRLVDAGIAHPRPPAGAGPTADELTIVIPVRDRPAQLARCLDAIARATAASMPAPPRTPSPRSSSQPARAADAPPTPRVLVVDDGSRDPAAVAAAASAAGARVVRHAASRGAAAARNTGLAHCETPFVALVDSDCLPVPGWLELLLPHLADPRVAAVAPRIVAHPPAEDTWLARFEERWSPLDMGAREGPVAPLSRIPYVPTATLIVRRAATGAGFDPAMAIGEDIDLVWNMHRAGWSVRYVPQAQVAHDHRVTFAAWLERRFVYGTSAAPLAVRHPGAIPAAVLSPWSAATLALLAACRPLAALATAAAATAMARRRLGAAAASGRPTTAPTGGRPTTATTAPHPIPSQPASADARSAAPPRARAGTTGARAAAPPPAPGLRGWREPARLVTFGTAWAGWSLAQALTRPWLPLSVIAAVSSKRARRTLLLGAVLPRAVHAVRERGRLDPARTLAATAADDAAYAAGLWWGCIEERTLGPLLPSRGRRPA